MRRDLSSSLSFVHVDDSRCVDRVPLVRIDGYTEKSRVGLLHHQQVKSKFTETSDTHVDQLCKIPLLQVVKDRGIVEICQVGHVLAFFVLWRIQLLEKVFLQSFLLFP